MTDIVTYCDVNTCEDCPRYGDDCDGERLYTHEEAWGMTDPISRADAIEAVRKVVIDNDAVEALKALPSAEAVPRLKQTDTLIIADALRYLAKDTERHLADRTRADALRQQFLQYGARMKGGAE